MAYCTPKAAHFSASGRQERLTRIDGYSPTDPVGLRARWKVAEELRLQGVDMLHLDARARRLIVEACRRTIGSGIEVMPDRLWIGDVDEVRETADDSPACQVTAVRQAVRCLPLVPLAAVVSAAGASGDGRTMWAALSHIVAYRDGQTDRPQIDYWQGVATPIAECVGEACSVVFC